MRKITHFNPTFSLAFLALFLWWSCLSGSETTRIRVAILDIEVAGIDSIVKIGLSNRLGAEIIKTGQFNVLERTRMQEILQEQGFQQTGVCNTDECIVEAGRVLGVSKMIAGSVAKVGNLFTISIRMIDVSTGRILFSATEDTPGPIENVLTTSLGNAAKKISVMAIAKPEEGLTGFGILRLESDPSEARIFIDDKIIPGETPILMDSISAGVHVVRFQKNLMAASQAIFVAPNEQTVVKLKLSRAKGRLKIVTRPEGAEILLDYESKGFSPSQLFELPVGAYFLKLVKPGFVDHSQIISITENETRFISASLNPMAILSIQTNPLECRVFIDDSLIGRSPLNSLKIKPGFHKIKIGKKGFANFEELHSIPAGEEANLNVTLRPAATLIIRSEPPEARIYLNDIYKGLTPLTISDINPGEIKLKLQRDNYQDCFEQIILGSGQIRKVNTNLQWKTGKLTIESIPAAAVVEIDGIYKGKTPLEIDFIEYGKHLVRVIKTGFQSYEQEVQIQSKMPELVKVKLKIGTGTLFLHPEPNDAALYLNGQKLGSIPTGGISLKPGTYRLSAIRPGYENSLLTMKIQPNKASTVNLRLTPKSRQKALVRSLFFPGLGQRYAEKRFRQYLFSIVEIASLTGILVSDIVYDYQIKTYHQSREDYVNAISPAEIERNRSQMENAFNDVESTKSLRTAFIITAVGTWMINILDSAIFAPVQPFHLSNRRHSRYPGASQFKLFVNQNPEKWQVGIAQQF